MVDRCDSPLHSLRPPSAVGNALSATDLAMSRDQRRFLATCKASARRPALAFRLIHSQKCSVSRSVQPLRWQRLEPVLAHDTSQSIGRWTAAPPTSVVVADDQRLSQTESRKMLAYVQRSSESVRCRRGNIVPKALSPPNLSTTAERAASILTFAKKAVVCPSSRGAIQLWSPHCHRCVYVLTGPSHLDQNRI
jgi:hypothetical protein